MAAKTYDLVFYNLVGDEDSIQTFSDLDAAKEALQLFDEPGSAEIYSRIALTEYDWTANRESVLKTLTFGTNE